MLTDDEIRALQSLEAQATPGPWTSQFNGFHVSDETGYEEVASFDLARDGECAVAARNALRPLCDEVLRLRAEQGRSLPLQGLWEVERDGLRAENAGLRARLAESVAALNLLMDDWRDSGGTLTTVAWEKGCAAIAAAKEPPKPQGGGQQ